MRTPFESQNILVQTGPARLIIRLLESMFPPSVCMLNDDPDIWHRFEVPQYREDDPARPLGYHESGARLKPEGIDASYEAPCRPRVSAVEHDF